MGNSQLANLKSRLGQLLEQDEARTYGYIEKNFGLAKSTLCRILSGATKTPRVPTIKKLEEAVFSLERETSSVNKENIIDEKLRKFWHATRQEEYMQEYRTLSPYQVEAITATETCYRTFLTISNCGDEYYTRDTLQPLIGHGVHAAVRSLIEKCIVIEEKDGTLKSRFPRLNVDSPEAMLRMNTYENSFFELSNLGESAAITRNTNCTSPEGVQAYRAAIYDFCRKISDIEKKYPGNIPFHVNCVGNILDSGRYYKSLRLKETKE